MPTIAAGTSATVTLNAGRSFEFTAGSGSASMFLPGSAVGQPYTLTAPGALGPFSDARTLYVAAQTAITYSTDGPAGPDGLTDAQVAGITSSVVDAAGTVLASGGALGPYTDLAALIAAKPAASNSGKTAMVGAAAPYSIFGSNGSRWAQVGATADAQPQRNWQRAIAGARAKSRYGRICLMGDSLTSGVSTVTLLSTSWPTVLGNMLAAAGYPVTQENMAGSKNLSPLTGAWSYDPRITFSGSGVNNFALGPSPGLFQMSAGGTITFVPTASFDRFRLLFLTNGSAGVITYNIDGGGAQTVNIPGTVNSFNSQQFSIAAGTHSMVLSFVSGTVFLCGVECWLSTDPKIQVINNGVSSRTMADLNQAGNWGVGSYISTLAADLTVMMLGTNDSTLATFQTALDVAIPAIKAAGSDLILCTYTPKNGADSNGPAKLAYIRSKAAATGTQLVDLDARWADYTTANGYGYLSDGIHYTPMGSAEVAQAVFEAITGSVRSL